MWARLVNTAVGIWLMASPSVLELGGAAKANSVICGALAASFSVIAIWEVTRGLRWVNLLVGCWLLISAFVFDFRGAAAVATAIVSGLVMAAMSLIRGPIKQQTGGGWSALFGRAG